MKDYWEDRLADVIPFVCAARPTLDAAVRPTERSAQVIPIRAPVEDEDDYEPADESFAIWLNFLVAIAAIAFRFWIGT